MPKGPSGEKRPADTNACAVKVGKIATGEVEETEYVAAGRKRSGEAGAAARKRTLSAARRREIGKIAAERRWGKTEAPMSEKQRLLDTLFNTEGREHLNLKFCRGFSDGILPEDLCREVNAAIFQAESGPVEARPRFGDGERKVVDLKEILPQH